MAAHSGLITVMERAARKAAPRLRRDFNEVQHLQVSRKGPADFVIDGRQARRADDLSRNCSKARPDWGFLMEERGEIAGDPTKPRFIVDPLDGTSNFLHGLPHFAISIAVEEPLPTGKREITTALVYQPLTDESFWAEKGRGAWLQDRAAARIGAARPDRSADRDRHPLSRAMAISRSGAAMFGAVAPEVAGIRRFGSAALDLAWVAAGRFDGFWESDLQPWDVAAGHAAGAGSGRFRHRFPRRRQADRAQANSSPRTTGCIAELHKLVAGALRNA